MMYNSKHQMWQSGSEPRAVNPMVFRWGMKEVSRVGNHGRGNSEDSWRTNTLPMPTGLAPPKHHGVFAFGDSVRQGALANGLHGLNPRNTALISPVSKRRPALIERLVKQMGHGETTHLYKQINPSRALGAFLFLYQSSLEKVSRFKPIHPWRNYV